jgi:type 1 fimbriae regulatory protein FimB
MKPPKKPLREDFKDDHRHLTPLEVGKLLDATKGSRNEARDRCLILLMFRHGLRVSEALGLKLNAVDVEGRALHVTRLKKGLSTTHPLRVDELRAIRAWLIERARMKPKTKALFVSERCQPLSRRTAWLFIREYGKSAGLDIAAHPHMLCHACGFAPAFRAWTRGSFCRSLLACCQGGKITLFYLLTRPQIT